VINFVKVAVLSVKNNEVLKMKKGKEKKNGEGYTSYMRDLMF